MEGISPGDRRRFPSGSRVMLPCQPEPGGSLRKVKRSLKSRCKLNFDGGISYPLDQKEILFYLETNLE